MVPPGHAAIRIMPTLYSGLTGAMKAIIKATIGNRIIWLASPVNTGFGRSSTVLKSLNVSESPIAMEIIAKDPGNNKSENTCKYDFFCVAANIAGRMDSERIPDTNIDERGII